MKKLTKYLANFLKSNWTTLFVFGFVLIAHSSALASGLSELTNLYNDLEGAITTIGKIVVVISIIGGAVSMFNGWQRGLEVAFGGLIGGVLLSSFKDLISKIIS